MLTCHSQDQEFGGVEVRHLDKLFTFTTLIDDDILTGLVGPV